MKYRKLRIAWSVAWGVVAVLVCVLWVRTSRNDLPTITLTFHPADDRRLFEDPPGNPFTHTEFTGMYFHTWSLGILGVPFWLLIATASMCAIGPQLRCRFRLRTLLIATTLIAGVPGLVVWASGKVQ